MINLRCQIPHVLTGLRCSLLVALLNVPTCLFAQPDVTLNLVELQQQGKLAASNRDVSIGQEGGRRFIKIEKQLRPGQIPGKDERGIVWLPVEKFSRGTIELVARGRDMLQGSFVGVAFHAQNDSTFDDVYCRPFNFRTSDPVRRIHAVQYVSVPQFDWQRLRAEQNGTYEKGVANPPAATDWFTLTVTVVGDSINVYINHEPTPTLAVKKLNQHTTGRIGLTGLNYDIERIRIRYEH